MSDMNLFSIIDQPPVILTLLYHSFKLSHRSTCNYSEEAVCCGGFQSNHQSHSAIEIFH